MKIDGYVFGAYAAEKLRIFGNVLLLPLLALYSMQHLRWKFLKCLFIFQPMAHLNHNTEPWKIYSLKKGA